MLVTIALNFKYSYVKQKHNKIVENIFIPLFFVLFENVILFEKKCAFFSIYDFESQVFFKWKKKTNYNEENNDSLSQLNMN